MTLQWKYPTIRPPAMGPSMGPIRPGMATKLMARMSSDLANVRTMVRRPTGTIMAPPQPCRMRHATSTWMLLEMPQRNDPSVNRPMADANTRRVPNRSAIQPLIGNEDRQAQGVAGQHRLHAERSHLERLRDGGHGRVQNRGVERLHEERDCDEPRQQPFGRAASFHYATLADSLREKARV